MSNELFDGSNIHILHIGIVDKPSTNPFTEDHLHPYDEVILLLGTDMNDPEDLGGEIEYYLGDERENHIEPIRPRPFGYQKDSTIISSSCVWIDHSY